MVVAYSVHRDVVGDSAHDGGVVDAYLVDHHIGALRPVPLSLSFLRKIPNRILIAVTTYRLLYIGPAVVVVCAVVDFDVAVPKLKRKMKGMKRVREWKWTKLR